MIVSELIAKLQEFNGDVSVLTYDCEYDCYMKVDAVSKFFDRRSGEVTGVVLEFN